jgi:hypothetical protein
MSARENQKTDKTIRKAIAHKHLIQFQYDGKKRIAEPHDYGIKGGVVRLFCYQIGGQSSSPLPNWRLLDVERISALELLERPFPGSRGSAYRKHLTWDQVFARVAAPAQEAP